MDRRDKAEARTSGGTVRFFPEKKEGPKPWRRYRNDEDAATGVPERRMREHEVMARKPSSFSSHTHHFW